MAVSKDIAIEQGETKVIPNLWRDKASGVPIDITGYSFYLQARASRSENSPLLLDASTDNGKIEIDPDPTTGVFTITLEAAYTQSLALPAEPIAQDKRAIFELVAVSPGGVVTKLRKGSLIFTSSVYYP